MLKQPQPGDRLDHYLLGEEVARSGMACIFRGTDTRTGQTVAVKLPHPEMECDVIFFDRFQREEKIGQQMDHPGVVKMLKDERRSRVYMVMEWVEGKALRDVLSGPRRLSPARATDLTIKILEALEYIHSQGVVHRDLKPENIIIGEHDSIKLIDFGLARKSGERRLTFRGFTKLMGTPDYISPEQVKGKRGDARADIYAAGIILYEMLTGQMPFQGPNPLAIMNARVQRNPVPARDVASDIPAALEEIIGRALERDPRERYANAREMAWDLAHQESLGAGTRPEAHEAERSIPRSRQILVYSGLAAIPAAIFALLLLVARNG